jgi:hypothetical protein
MKMKKNVYYLLIAIFIILNSCSSNRYSTDLMLGFKQIPLDSFDFDLATYKLEIDTISDNSYWYIRVFHNNFSDLCCDCFDGNIEIRNDTLRLIVKDQELFNGKYKCQIETNHIYTSYFEYQLLKNENLRYYNFTYELDSVMWYPLCK